MHAVAGGGGTSSRKIFTPAPRVCLLVNEAAELWHSAEDEAGAACAATAAAGAAGHRDRVPTGPPPAMPNAPLVTQPDARHRRTGGRGWWRLLGGGAARAAGEPDRLRLVAQTKTTRHSKAGFGGCLVGSGAAAGRCRRRRGAEEVRKGARNHRRHRSNGWTSESCDRVGG